MPETAVELMCRYLQDAIAAESAFETQLKTFSEEGDDDEVQALFAEHARQTSTQIERLTNRMEALGGQRPSKAKSLMAHVFALAPRAAQLTHSQEERLTQNLISAYSVEMSECAMYEALRVVADLAGDTLTGKLAKEIAAEERETAIKLWQLLPSRSKIAFNVSTAGEVDPAIETRAPDDRIV